MSIIARRIPSGLGYLPNYTVRAHTVRGGLGVSEALGWFMPASVAPTTTSTAPALTPAPAPAGCTGGYIKNAYGYCVPPPAPTKSTDWGALATSLTSMFAPKPPAPAATPGMAYTPPAPSGMSKGTMLAIGLGAAGLLAVVMLTRK